MWNDETRAVVMGFLTPLINWIVIMQWWNPDSDQLAGFNVLISSGVIFAFYIAKKLEMRGKITVPTLNPVVLIIIGATTMLALFAFSSTPTAKAAIDCETTYRLQIDITDDEGERITVKGALVTIAPDPKDGVGERLYVDNGANDDSNVIGRVRENLACATTEGDTYAVTLEFNDEICDIVGADVINTTLIADTEIEFAVDNCEDNTPTPTPTARVTRTPTPAPTWTPNPTWTPQPTATNMPMIWPTFQVVINPTPAPVVTNNTGVIRPPSTGDGGLIK